MTAFQAMILGLIQGLTEFLPVSSSGHLIFIPKLLGWADQGVAFDLVMHLGTLLAVVIYFRVKLWNLVKAVFSRGTQQASERKLAWVIALSCIPAAIVGLLLETNDRNAVVVAGNLIFWGLVLGAADFYARKKTPVNAVETEKKSLRSIIIMSFVQLLALIPGTSRSGITMTAGLFSGLTRARAAEFSFLMSVPITALAGAHAMYELSKIGLAGIGISSLLVGFVSAFVFGLIAIFSVLKIVQRWSFMPFVIYRVLIGILILVMLV